MNELIEILADLEHERWSHWQTYVHSICIKNLDGSLTIPKNFVERWEKEIDTSYKNLSKKIQQSDKVEAQKIINKILDSNYVLEKNVHLRTDNK